MGCAGGDFDCKVFYCPSDRESLAYRRADSLEIDCEGIGCVGDGRVYTVSDRGGQSESPFAGSVLWSFALAGSIISVENRLHRVVSILSTIGALRDSEFAIVG
jgi:hypothetical protein